MDRAEPPGVRHVPHPDALSGDPAVSADGGRGPAAAPQLGPVRHGPRRFSAPAPDAGAAGGGVRLVLRAAVFAPLDLAAAAPRLAGGAAVSGDVVPVQEVEPLLAASDPPQPDGPRLGPAGGVDPATARALSSSP